jgi:hypothetical protein
LFDQENNDTPLLKTVANSAFTDNDILGIVRVIICVSASSCPFNVLKTSRLRNNTPNAKDLLDGERVSVPLP